MIWLALIMLYVSIGVVVAATSYSFAEKEGAFKDTDRISLVISLFVLIMIWPYAAIKVALNARK